MEKKVKLPINIKGNWLNGECMYMVPLKEMHIPPRLALIIYLQSIILSRLESNAER
jgi:hypothetical protein